MGAEVRVRLGAALLILLAGLAAYSDSFSGPFLFDDIPSIPQNLTIRRLWPPGPIFHPPMKGGITVCGRPILNLSFALNYAIGSLAVEGYHAVNLLIHLLAALLLFEIVRRTLERVEFSEGALPVATLAALFWALHPAQTESVTYLVQRAESLCGLFYLLTLYFFIRGVDEKVSRRSFSEGGWVALSIVACALGMGTKEMMVTAPLMIWLYDRTFVAGSFAKALQSRTGYYAALAATWIALALCMADSAHRGNTTGIGIGISPGAYALTETRALATYLGIALWPHPLLFDYGPHFFLRHGTQAVPYLFVLVPLLGAIAWALVRRPKWGFLGAWFFLILAPTSSFVPLKDALWDHRLYLSLAAWAVLLALLLWHWLGRRAWTAALAIAFLYGIGTWQRNHDYQSEQQMWRLTAAACPSNPRAHNNLAAFLLSAGDVEGSVAECRLALELFPDYADAHNNLGLAFLQTGALPAAIAEFRQALQIAPRDYKTRLNLGVALMREGEWAQAREEFLQVLEIEPECAEAHFNLAGVAFHAGNRTEAITRCREALQLRPDYAKAQALLHDLGAK